MAESLSPPHRRTERAVVVGVPGIYMARALAGLEAGGIDLVGAWITRSVDQSVDLYMERRNPAFSTRTFFKRHGVTPERLSSRSQFPQLAQALKRAEATLLLSTHCGLRIPPDVLDLLPARCLNLHPALLPAMRGPHPLEILLSSGLAVTQGGATLHQMTEGFDEGPIVAQERVPLAADCDVIDWELGIARAYGRLCAEPLRDYLDGRQTALPQDESKVSYAKVYDAASELHLHEGLHAAEAIYRARVFGQTRTLFVYAGGQRWRAMLPARFLGPATGKPPRLGLWELSFDVSDARLSLRRRWPGAGRRQRRRRWRRWARAKP